MKIKNIFKNDRNFIYILHALVVGPFLGLLGYYSYYNESNFEHYENEIKTSYMILMWVGLIVTIYHSYKLYSNL